MPILVHCDCGKATKVRDELAGKKIRCPKCKAVMEVPEPLVEPLEEDDPEFLVEAGEPPLPTPKPAKKRTEESDDEAMAVSAKPLPASKRRRADDDDDEEEEETPRKKKKRRDPWGTSIRRRRRREEASSGFGGIAISPMIIGGLLAMGGAVLWFVLGIVLLDTVFCYPPVLFVLGIVSFVRGCMGQED